MTARVETFRVVAANGSTLNLVKTAVNERDSEPMDIKVEKRRQEAELKRQQWSYNYFGHTETLRIVACDRQGNIIPEAVVEPLPEARFRRFDNEQADS